jgi:hypothetical protein
MWRNGMNLIVICVQSVEETLDDASSVDSCVSGCTKKLNQEARITTYG